jgi:hypothetical protein
MVLLARSPRLVMLLAQEPLLKIYKPKMQLTKQKTEYPPSTEELRILCNTNVFWKIFLTDGPIQMLLM